MLWNDDYIKLTPDVNAVARAQPNPSEFWAGPGCGVDGPSVKWNKASIEIKTRKKILNRMGLLLVCSF